MAHVDEEEGLLTPLLDFIASVWISLRLVLFRFFSYVERSFPLSFC